MAKSDSFIHSLARRGAETRLQELNDEIHAIVRAFPELRQGRAQRQAATPSATNGATPNGNGATKSRRQRRKMTTAQRKAVGDRMRKYWAARKKGKA